MRLTHLEFVDGVLADDVLEVDDVLVLETRQHLHLSQRPLAERLRERERVLGMGKEETPRTLISQ